MTRERAGEAHLQQLGELTNDLLAVLAEERDDLCNELRGAPVLEHLQLLELIVQQTLTPRNNRKVKFPKNIELPIHLRRN